ncbi:MAG: ribonuclease P protein component [Coraliomargaritaceae bacterium]|jgi:ribonuclease P protein component
MGIPKEFRIKNSNEFSSIRSSGLRRVLPYFITQLKFVDSDKQESKLPTRLGIIASRRVGNAVVRNRGKRIFRRLFHKHHLLLPAGSQLIVVLRLGFDKVSFAKLENDFLESCAWYGKKFTQNNEIG